MRGFESPSVHHVLLFSLLMLFSAISDVLLPLGTSYQERNGNILLLAPFLPRAWVPVISSGPSLVIPVWQCHVIR